ncbi:hypothetical protein QBZ16_004122 [Prototheca wickerhamii]|uniref:protein-serine/threonine phosphatase n=1 Tax=Prototheca wickerhamii TaxID=3111 RepID=A0AAD9IIM2_PROWI|nr:hypothetical protein QBZ16_004122 [Prototheca wickerhamii]
MQESLLLSEDRKVHGSGMFASVCSWSSFDGGSMSQLAEVDHGSQDGSASAASLSPSLAAQGSGEHSHHGASRAPLRGFFSALRAVAHGLMPHGAADAAAPRAPEPAFGAVEAAVRPALYWLGGQGGAARAADESEDEDAAHARLQEAASASRWLKSDCQDEVAVVRDFAGVPGQLFVGVFDGHGPFGRAAACFAARALPGLMADSGAFSGAGACPAERELAAAAACVAVHAEMASGRAGFDPAMSGTTACFAVLCGCEVMLGNVGDSRAVVVRRAAREAPRPAKAPSTRQSARVEAAGGEVRRLLDGDGLPAGAARVFARGDAMSPGLAMSRSLGDAAAHALGVLATPEVSWHLLDRERDAALALATDGVWDVVSDDDAARLVAALAPSAAGGLTLEAMERWKRGAPPGGAALIDDIAAVIVHVAPPAPGGAPASDASFHGARRASSRTHPDPLLARRVPPSLAAAAGSNEEANALYGAWLADPELNPCTRPPRAFFSDVLGAAPPPVPLASALPSDGPALVVGPAALEDMVRRGSDTATAIAAAGGAQALETRPGLRVAVAAAAPRPVEALRPVRRAYLRPGASGSDSSTTPSPVVARHDDHKVRGGRRQAANALGRVYSLDNTSLWASVTRTRSLDENSVGGGLEEAAVASAPALGPRLLSSFSSRTSPRVLRPLDEPN